MTKAETRAIALAIAFAPIPGTSVELEPIDRENIRDEVALAVARSLGMDGDAFLAQMQALGMSATDEETAAIR